MVTVDVDRMSDFLSEGLHIGTVQQAPVTMLSSAFSTEFSALGEAVRGQWKPDLHPRDSHGRFRDKWSLSAKARQIVERILSGFDPVSLRSDDHAASYLNQHKKPRSKGQEATLDYFLTREGNEDIQSSLRAGIDLKRPSTQGTRVRDLDGMMAPLDNDLILSRVLGPDAFGLPPERINEVEEWTGKLIDDLGYSPTNIGTPHPVAGPHVEMRIVAPRGTKAIIKGDGSRTVILDREQPVQLGKIQSNGQGGFYILATVMPKSGSGTPPRALGRELAPGDKSPAIDATPDELARRGLTPEGENLPPGPLPPAGTPAPSEQGLPPHTPAPQGAPLEQAPPAEALQKEGGIPVGAGKVVGPDTEVTPREKIAPPKSKQVIPEDQARLADEQRRIDQRQAALDEREARMARLQELDNERLRQENEQLRQQVEGTPPEPEGPAPIRADRETTTRLARTEAQKDADVVRRYERLRNEPGFPRNPDEERIQERAQRVMAGTPTPEPPKQAAKKAASGATPAPAKAAKAAPAKKAAPVKKAVTTKAEPTKAVPPSASSEVVDIALKAETPASSPARGSIRNAERINRRGGTPGEVAEELRRGAEELRTGEPLSEGDLPDRRTNEEEDLQDIARSDASTLERMADQVEAAAGTPEPVKAAAPRAAKKVAKAAAPKAARPTTLTELRREATQLKIPGRSTMTREVLESALANRRKREGESDEAHAARVKELNTPKRPVKAAPAKKTAPAAKKAAPAKAAAPAKKATPPAAPAAAPGSLLDELGNDPDVDIDRPSGGKFDDASQTIRRYASEGKDTPTSLRERADLLDRSAEIDRRLAGIVGGDQSPDGPLNGASRKEAAATAFRRRADRLETGAPTKKTDEEVDAETHRRQRERVAEIRRETRARDEERKKNRTPEEVQRDEEAAARSKELARRTSERVQREAGEQDAATKKVTDPWLEAAGVKESDLSELDQVGVALVGEQVRRGRISRAEAGRRLSRPNEPADSPINRVAAEAGRRTPTKKATPPKATPAKKATPAAPEAREAAPEVKETAADKARHAKVLADIKERREKERAEAKAHNEARSVISSDGTVSPSNLRRDLVDAHGGAARSRILEGLDTTLSRKRRGERFYGEKLPATEWRKIAKALGVKGMARSDSPAIKAAIVKYFADVDEARKADIRAQKADTKDRLREPGVASRILSAADKDPHHRRRTGWGAGLFESDRGGDVLGEHIARQQGFDQLPDVVTREEFEQRRGKDIGLVLYRGVNTTGRAEPGMGREFDGKPASEVHDEFREGRYHMGIGSFGNGTYMTKNSQHAKGYSDLTDGAVARYGLAKDAKIIELPDLAQEHADYIKGLDADSPEMKVFGDDLGRYAMAKGYDAIHVPRGSQALGVGPDGAKDQYVILNRGKVIAEAPGATGTVAEARKAIRAKAVPAKKVAPKATPTAKRTAAKAPAKAPAKFLAPLADGTQRKSATNVEVGDVVSNSYNPSRPPMRVTKVERIGEGTDRLRITLENGDVDRPSPNTVYWIGRRGGAKKAAAKAAPGPGPAPLAPGKGRATKSLPMQGNVPEAAPGTAKGRITSSRITPGTRILLEKDSNGNWRPTTRKTNSVPFEVTKVDRVQPSNRTRTRVAITAKDADGNEVRITSSPSQTHMLEPEGSVRARKAAPAKAAKKVAPAAAPEGIPEKLPTSVAALRKLGKDNGIPGADTISADALRDGLRAKREDPSVIPVSQELFPPELREHMTPAGLREIGRSQGVELKGQTTSELLTDLVRKTMGKGGEEKAVRAERQDARKAAAAKRLSEKNEKYGPGGPSHLDLGELESAKNLKGDSALKQAQANLNNGETPGKVATYIDEIAQRVLGSNAIRNGRNVGLDKTRMKDDPEYWGPLIAQQAADYEAGQERAARLRKLAAELRSTRRPVARKAAPPKATPAKKAVPAAAPSVDPYSRAGMMQRAKDQGISTKVADLREQAKRQGVPNYQKLRQEQLLFEVLGPKLSPGDMDRMDERLHREARARIIGPEVVAPAKKPPMAKVSFKKGTRVRDNNGTTGRVTSVSGDGKSVNIRWDNGVLQSRRSSDSVEVIAPEAAAPAKKAVPKATPPVKKVTAASAKAQSADAIRAALAKAESMEEAHDLLKGLTVAKLREVSPASARVSKNKADLIDNIAAEHVGGRLRFKGMREEPGSENRFLTSPGAKKVTPSARRGELHDLASDLGMDETDAKRIDFVQDKLDGKNTIHKGKDLGRPLTREEVADEIDDMIKNPMTGLEEARKDATKNHDLDGAVQAQDRIDRWRALEGRLRASGPAKKATPAKATAPGAATPAERLAAGHADVPDAVNVTEDQWHGMSYSERLQAIVSARSATPTAEKPVSFAEARRRGMAWGKANGYEGHAGGWITEKGSNKPIVQGWDKLYYAKRKEIEADRRDKEAEAPAAKKAAPAKKATPRGSTELSDRARILALERRQAEESTPVKAAAKSVPKATPRTASSTEAKSLATAERLRGMDTADEAEKYLDDNEVGLDEMRLIAEDHGVDPIQPKPQLRRAIAEALAGNGSKPRAAKKAAPAAKAATPKLKPAPVGTAGTGAEAARYSTRPLQENTWGGAGGAPGTVHYHEDGPIGVAVGRMGAKDRTLDIDGEPLANRVGQLATDGVTGRKTSQQVIDGLRELRDRTPAGSKARSQLDDAIKQIDAPERSLSLPDSTPPQLKRLMQKLEKIPLARKNKDEFGRPEFNEMDELVELANRIDRGDVRALRLGDEIREKLWNRRHESYGAEGKFEIDRIVREAIDDIEKAVRDPKTGRTFRDHIQEPSTRTKGDLGDANAPTLDTAARTPTGVDRARQRLGARSRNQRIERTQGAVNLAQELRSINDTDRKSFVEAVRQRVEGNPGDVSNGRDMAGQGHQDLAEALGDVSKLDTKAKVDARLRKFFADHGITEERKVGDKVDFDPDTMDTFPGVNIAPGDKVEVARPGYRYRDKDTGDEIQLTKPIVVREGQGRESGPLADTTPEAAAPEGPRPVPEGMRRTTGPLGEIDLPKAKMRDKVIREPDEARDFLNDIQQGVRRTPDNILDRADHLSSEDLRKAAGYLGIQTSSKDRKVTLRNKVVREIGRRMGFEHRETSPKREELDLLSTAQLKERLPQGVKAPAGASRAELVDMVMGDEASSPRHTSLTPAQEEIKRALDEGATDVKSLGGGSMGRVTLVQGGDGRKYVRKRLRRDWFIGAEEQADAEALWARAAREIGVPAPAAYSPSQRTVVMDHVPWKLASRHTQEEVDAAVATSEGRRLHIMDLVSGNVDRHNDNWMIDDQGRPIPIDNALAFRPEMQGTAGASRLAPGNDGDAPPAALHGLDPFRLHYKAQLGDYDDDGISKGNIRWAKKVKFSRSELLDVRQKLQGLKPEFTQLGRDDWHDQMMARLDALIKRAPESEAPSGALSPRQIMEDLRNPGRIRSAFAPPVVRTPPAKAAGRAAVPSSQIIRSRQVSEMFPDAGSNGHTVKNVKLRENDPFGSYTIPHGTVWRRGDVTYLVEHEDTPAGRSYAHSIQRSIERYHASLPDPRFISSYSWVQGRNPQDDYFQYKYKIPRFTSSATAGADGNTTLWARSIFKEAREISPTLDHEYGHQLESRNPLGISSESPEWTQAAELDARTREGIQDFRPRPSSLDASKEVRLTPSTRPGDKFVNGVTGYGSVHAHEDFGESARLYMSGVLGWGRREPGGPLEPIWFRDLFPERAKYLDQILPQFGYDQRAQILRIRSLPTGQRSEAASASGFWR